MLEKTLESPLDCKEIQPVHPKGDQSWLFIGRTDAEAETPILWPPHAKSWLIGKDSDAGRGWRQEEKGTTEDEMAGWHHWLNEHEFGWTPGVGDGQGGLVCCDSWGRKESDTTEWLNWTELRGDKLLMSDIPKISHQCWQLYTALLLSLFLYPLSHFHFKESELPVSQLWLIPYFSDMVSQNILVSRIFWVSTLIFMNTWIKFVFIHHFYSKHLAVDIKQLWNTWQILKRKHK